ncbi:hypothetical protein HBHAL_3173 [Halobacillus halophilus DSM 2266]|uniref:Uncharacterized protein n=1 Tax=Halobacillus halophilus (strain ATCC 35676 / DSM 2266 / JCM 20832 / KCTC 3685 / LMG 17431 / NBRC 102448 / NCIMB 2269) TaxID=866895 RepID=I0JMZ8_HALH3|nr:hypothetical protein HBHAL_3173 [Halobacillus halophilus DSM 2266]
MKLNYKKEDLVDPGFIMRILTRIAEREELLNILVGGVGLK